MVARVGDGFQLIRWGRPILGEPLLVPKRPEGSRQLGGESRTPARLLKGSLVAPVLAA
jgi:hypothetical protein